MPGHMCHVRTANTNAGCRVAQPGCSAQGPSGKGMSSCLSKSFYSPSVQAGLTTQKSHTGQKFLVNPSYNSCFHSHRIPLMLLICSKARQKNVQMIEARREKIENRIGNESYSSDSHEIEKHNLSWLFKVVRRDMLCVSQKERVWSGGACIFHFVASSEFVSLGLQLLNH